MPRIMLVDDDCNVLRSLGRTLHFIPLSLVGEPVTVESFDRPEAALSRASECSFSLVIVDYLMASMSGVDFLKRFTQIHPDTPRALLSGFATVLESMEKVRDLGAIEIIPKPWDNEQLFNCVRRAVGAQKPARKPLFRAQPSYAMQ